MEQEKAESFDISIDSWTSQMARSSHSPHELVQTMISSNPNVQASRSAILEANPHDMTEMPATEIPSNNLFLLRETETNKQDVVLLGNGRTYEAGFTTDCGSQTFKTVSEEASKNERSSAVDGLNSLSQSNHLCLSGSQHTSSSGQIPNMSNCNSRGLFVLKDAGTEENVNSTRTTISQQYLDVHKEATSIGLNLRPENNPEDMVFHEPDEQSRRENNQPEVVERKEASSPESASEPEYLFEGEDSDRADAESRKENERLPAVQHGLVAHEEASFLGLAVKPEHQLEKKSQPHQAPGANIFEGIREGELSRTLQTYDRKSKLLKIRYHGNCSHTLTKFVKIAKNHLDKGKWVELLGIGRALTTVIEVSEKLKEGGFAYIEDIQTSSILYVRDGTSTSPPKPRMQVRMKRVQG